MRPFILICAGALLASPQSAQGQEADDSLVDRPLATRAELERLSQRLASRSAQDELLARVRARLTQGDFHPGDLVLLEVQGEATLSDTFPIGPGGELTLPSPVVGTLPLRGVLRAELQDTVTRYLGRFLNNPQVRARALLRLSIQGEVARAGVYGVPAEGKLGDALMAAGGTTQFADMRKVRVEREGTRVWEGRSLEQGINDLSLRDGDQVFVASRRQGGLGNDLRFVWLIVSLAGGIYGLSRAVH